MARIAALTIMYDPPHGRLFKNDEEICMGAVTGCFMILLHRFGRSAVLLWTPDQAVLSGIHAQNVQFAGITVQVAGCIPKNNPINTSSARGSISGRLIGVSVVPTSNRPFQRDDKQYPVVVEHRCSTPRCGLGKGDCKARIIKLPVEVIHPGSRFPGERFGFPARASCTLSPMPKIGSSHHG